MAHIELSRIEKIAIGSILERQRKLAEEHAKTQQELNEVTLEIFQTREIDLKTVVNPQLNEAGTGITYKEVEVPPPPKKEDPEKDGGNF